MRLSTRGQYAVRAMVNLAYYSKGMPVTLRDISKREQISINYLEQLFSKLRRGGIVKSVKGPGGGYILARSPEDIRIGEIIEMVEEPLNPVACLDGKDRCDRSAVCVTQRVWKELGMRIRDFLNSITIYDLTKDVEDIYTFNNTTEGVRREEGVS